MTTLDEARSWFSFISIFDAYDIEQLIWNQLSSLRRITELRPSHIKQVTAKHKKDEINHHTNGC